MSSVIGIQHGEVVTIGGDSASGGGESGLVEYLHRQPTRRGPGR
jgi:hypothetical protein